MNSNKMHPNKMHLDKMHPMPHHRRKLLNLCLLVPVAAVASTSAGCLINAEGEKIVRDDEVRRTVDFESENGLERFQQAVRQRGSWSSRYQGESSFGIPFIVGIQQTRVISENAYYNDQVSAADVNGDSVLSDAEVRAYAGSF